MVWSNLVLGTVCALVVGYALGLDGRERLIVGAVVYLAAVLGDIELSLRALNQK